MSFYTLCVLYVSMATIHIANEGINMTGQTKHNEMDRWPGNPLEFVQRMDWNELEEYQRMIQRFYIVSDICDFLDEYIRYPALTTEEQFLLDDILYRFAEESSFLGERLGLHI